MKPPFVVLACGNPSRGDDALGPLLLARLAEWLEGEGLGAQFELIEDFQFQVEHALDLEERLAILFIDAAVGMSVPWSLAPLAAEDDGPGHCSHALTPGAVLAVFARVNQTPAPPAEILCLRAESFVLGEALSPDGADSLAAAWPILQRWCRERIASCRDRPSS